MSKLKIMLDEANTFLNNSEEDEKVVLILCGTVGADLLERANLANKELTGREVIACDINMEVYLLRTGETNKMVNALRENKGSTFFIYNHKHLLSRAELDQILDDLSLTYNAIFYEDTED